eukprot:2275669-Amphidinium_carterae.1
MPAAFNHSDHLGICCAQHVHTHTIVPGVAEMLRCQKGWFEQMPEVRETWWKAQKSFWRALDTN